MEWLQNNGIYSFKFTTHRDELLKRQLRSGSIIWCLLLWVSNAEWSVQKKGNQNQICSEKSSAFPPPYNPYDLRSQIRAIWLLSHHTHTCLRNIINFSNIIHSLHLHLFVNGTMCRAKKTNIFDSGALYFGFPINLLEMLAFIWPFLLRKI